MMEYILGMVVQFVLDWALLSMGILYATWIYFTAIMRLREVRDQGNLTFRKRPFNFILAMPSLAVGLVLDVLANWIFFTVIGLELPKPKELLSTWRMNRWFSSKDLSLLARWRRGVANFFGVQILDDIDPSGRHIK